jgi:hypothetical protein
MPFPDYEEIDSWWNCPWRANCRESDDHLWWWAFHQAALCAIGVHFNSPHSTNPNVQRLFKKSMTSSIGTEPSSARDRFHPLSPLGRVERRRYMAIDAVDTQPFSKRLAVDGGMLDRQCEKGPTHKLICTRVQHVRRGRSHSTVHRLWYIVLLIIWDYMMQ